MEPVPFMGSHAQLHGALEDAINQVAKIAQVNGMNPGCWINVLCCSIMRVALVIEIKGKDSDEVFFRTMRDASICLGHLYDHHEKRQRALQRKANRAVKKALANVNPK